MFFCMLNTYALYGRKTPSVLCTKYFICIVFIPQIKYRKNCLLCYHDCMQNLWLICIKQTSFHGLKMWYSVPVYLSYANRYILYMENRDSSYWKIILMQWILEIYSLYLFSIKKFHAEHLKLQREAMEHYYSMRPEREREKENFTTQKLFWFELLKSWKEDTLGQNAG